MAGEPALRDRHAGLPEPPIPPIGILARARLRFSPLKSAALFILPLPLLIAAITGLVDDDTSRLALSASALGSFWTAGFLTLTALTAEMRYRLGDQFDLPAFPHKLVAALLTTLGAALAAVAGGHSVGGATVFAALAGVGHVCFYGRDPKPLRVTVTEVEGIDVASVTGQLEQAYGRLRRIDTAARGINVPEFQIRLARITSVGRQILDRIAQEPRDATRARRFLHLYLDSTERVTEEYARTHHGVRTGSLEENFRRLLIEMENTFSQQHRRLLESDVMSLDVDIEVLNARLKSEGLSEPVEKR